MVLVSYTQYQRGRLSRGRPSGVQNPKHKYRYAVIRPNRRSGCSSSDVNTNECWELPRPQCTRYLAFMV